VQLTDAQIRRYARHILLPEVGGTGQARLLAARVRVDDARSPAATAALVYLIAAGVGTLVVVDDGVVEDVGFLYERSDLGQPVGDAIAARALALNPDVRVEKKWPANAPPAVLGVGGTYHVGLTVSGDPLEDGALAAARIIAEIVR
jgi:hypothetical protein